MAKPSAEAPRRWSAKPEAETDAALSELFRAVADPRPLSPVDLARVHDRLGSKVASPAARRMRELFMAGGMVMLGSSLALAGWGASEWVMGRSQKAQPLVPKTAAQQVARTASGAPRPKEKQLAVAVPRAEEPAPGSSAAAGAPLELDTRQAKAQAGAELRNVSPSPTESSALAAEALVLERALIKLRREHDAQGALAVLDESRALFAQGTLALEARMARVDALLALGRRDDALATLEQLPLDRIGRGGELKLIRAELRASADCARALTDFDALVTQTLAAPLMERALYGRAACELQVGDRTHAERDFKQYLTRFPQGRFAARIQSQLANASGKAQ